MRIDCKSLQLDQIDSSEQLRLACLSIAKNGFVILDNVIDTEKVFALHNEFKVSYKDYLQDLDLPDTLKVGNKRYMMPVALSGGFGNSEIYANPFVIPIVQRVLGLSAILESFGAVISLGAARQQKIHRDGGLLYDTGIGTVLPSYALTFALPLIDMNETHGKTSFWPGSHRWTEYNEDATPVTPDVPVGSCVLWDFRLYHCGTVNRSDVVRPLLYGTYARHWYLDPGNFIKKGQRRLIYTQEFLDSLNLDCRGLFHRAIENGFSL